MNSSMDQKWRATCSKQGATMLVDCKAYTLCENGWAAFKYRAFVIFKDKKKTFVQDTCIDQKKNNPSWELNNNYVKWMHTHEWKKKREKSSALSVKNLTSWKLLLSDYRVFHYHAHTISDICKHNATELIICPVERRKKTLCNKTFIIN